jgi:hypothetical protein
MRWKVQISPSVLEKLRAEEMSGIISGKLFQGRINMMPEPWPTDREPVELPNRVKDRRLSRLHGDMVA